MNFVRHANVWLAAGLLVILAALPFLISGYWTFRVSMIMVYAIAILGLNLLTGFCGQISLGHSAFFAVGAYLVAILMVKFGLPYWIAIPCAGFFCFVFGTLFGIPGSRLEGHYLALATFALAVAIPQFLKHDMFEHWTGGAQGLFVAKPEAPLGVPLNGDQLIYFVSLMSLLVVMLFARYAVQGKFGRAMQAVRDNPVAAEAMGINIAFLKTSVFGLSACYAGIAGGISALIVEFVAPDSFTIFLSIFLFVGMVVGGLQTLAGALIGALFIVIVPDISSGISSSAPGVIFGILLILMMSLMPRGVWEAIRSLRARGAGRRARDATRPVLPLTPRLP